MTGVAIRLPENSVNDVVAHFSGSDVLALNSYFLFGLEKKVTRLPAGTGEVRFLRF